jgi:hypothetical protein
MRNFSQLVVALPLLASQVASTLPFSATAPVTAVAEAEGSKNQKLVFDRTSSTPVQIKIVKADFDNEVLAKLKAAQAEKARLEAARMRARRVVRTVTPVVIPGGDVWAALRMCEAGGIYNRNSGNGYYGAYQFDIGTWNNYGGFARADLAPPAVQDAKARETQARRGWYPWPGCARKLGLI